MSKMIFINLPVADLGKATAFCKALGAVRNDQFSDETGSCMVFSDTIHAMLLTHARFRDFTSKPIADAHAATEVLVALSVESRADVDQLAAMAIRAGGRADPALVQDHGFMYSRSVEDPDGHIWELFWMDMNAAPDAA
jgi:predicted lactoylglutathione lyase